MTVGSSNTEEQITWQLDVRDSEEQKKMTIWMFNHRGKEHCNWMVKSRGTENLTDWMFESRGTEHLTDWMFEYRGTKHMVVWMFKYRGTEHMPVFVFKYRGTEYKSVGCVQIQRNRTHGNLGCLNIEEQNTWQFRVLKYRGTEHMTVYGAQI